MFRALLALHVLIPTSVYVGATTTHTSSTTTSLTLSSNATCPSRTINYITHGLPQQCLTSSWRSTPTSAPTNSTSEGVAHEDEQATPIYAANVTTALHDTSKNATEPAANSIPAPSNDESDTSSVIVESPAPASQSLALTPVDSDEPSPLEDVKFKSFEEWKRENLQKVGQSEHIGRDARQEPQIPRKRPTNIHTALDSLGDDAEIDLDFSGIIPSGPDLTGAEQHRFDTDPEAANEHQTGDVPSLGSRSKDAGTTCKERYNYASFDCAASVRKTNPEAMSATAVLGENKDSYMLNVCSADNKFLILELCNDISIDTIVLANFEFFSSIFRTFRVSVSDKYPVKIDKWKTLATFEARNSRDIQAFLVENPAIWARYLRIEFLTHYGSEYYCPVSLVRVHGTTMMEEYKHDLETLQAGDDDPESEGEALAAAGETLVPEAVADVILHEKEREAHEVGDNTAGGNEEPASVAQPDADKAVESDATSTVTQTSDPVTSLGDMTTNEASQSTLDAATGSTTSSETSVSVQVSAGIEPPERVPLLQSQNNDTIANGHSISSSLASGSESISTAGNELNTTITTASESITHPSSTAAELKDFNTTDASRLSQNSTASERPKSSSTTTQSAAAVPTMQESFFKSVQKRLQMLEANSSLSLQYIEDQSRALRDAFNKVEQRQLTKTSTFLDYLNTTVLSELRDFRQQYDQLWQSTVIELETQRERYQQETAAINARLGILADELIFQKRISILQMTLILICLGLVLFTRGNLNQYLEIPVVQRVLSRSPSSRWLNLAGLDTPTQSPPPTREGSLMKRHGILKGHRRMQSEDSIEGSLSPQDIYSPPSPVSLGDVSDGEPIRGGPKLEDPEFDPSTLERPSTSPPILPSSGTPTTPVLDGVVGQDLNSIESRLLNTSPGPGIPKVVIEDVTPTAKHLKWSLPEG